MSHSAPAMGKRPSTLRGATLPKWSPWAIAAGAIVLAVVIGLVGGLDSKVQWGLIAGILFVLGTYGIAARVEGRRQAKDRVATSLVWVCFLIAVVPLASLIWTTVKRGVKVFDVYFLTHSMGVVADSEPGGGIYHAIIGTLEQVGLATLIAAPIGVLTAVYLVEYGRGKLSTAITFFVDVMTGIPSIVAGLFILSLMLILDLEPFGFAGSLALAILMMPVVVRSTEEMLKLVPNELREASWRSACPSGARSSRWSCRPRSVASRPVSCSPSHASRARPPRCCCWCGAPTSSTPTRSPERRPRCRCTSTSSTRTAPVRTRRTTVPGRLRSP